MFFCVFFVCVDSSVVKTNIVESCRPEKSKTISGVWFTYAVLKNFILWKLYRIFALLQCLFNYFIFFRITPAYGRISTKISLLLDLRFLNTAFVVSLLLSSLSVRFCWSTRFAPVRRSSLAIVLPVWVNCGCGQRRRRAPLPGRSCSLAVFIFLSPFLSLSLFVWLMSAYRVDSRGNWPVERQNHRLLFICSHFD